MLNLGMIPFAEESYLLAKVSLTEKYVIVVMLYKYLASHVGA
jgi:hypothetical protein